MQSGENSINFLSKVIIIGDAGVGKTCLLLRFCEDSFLTSHLPTIGIDFKQKSISVDDKTVRLQIWDTAGQERFKTITQTYFKSAQGVVIAYSVGDETSFKNVKDWIEQVKTHASSDVNMVLVGNKTDLPGRVVTYEEGEILAKAYDIPFFEASTKEGVNIKSIFESLVRRIIVKTTFDVDNAKLRSSYSTHSVYLAKQKANEGKCCGKN